MSTEALREQIRLQVRQAVQRSRSRHDTCPPETPVRTAVVVPLRVSSAQHSAALTQLFKRLAAQPALLQMVDAGWLRFDLRVDASALQALDAPPTSNASASEACCSACQAGKACECQGDRCDQHPHPAQTPAVPELSGVIGEKLVKALPPGVNTVRLHPKAVATPLGKEALRKRGITIERGAQP